MRCAVLVACSCWSTPRARPPRARPPRATQRAPPLPPRTHTRLAWLGLIGGLLPVSRGRVLRLLARCLPRGTVPNNAYPFAYTPHYAQYTDPVSGNTRYEAPTPCTKPPSALSRLPLGVLALFVAAFGERCCAALPRPFACGRGSKIIVVPAAQAMGWQDGYECYGCVCRAARPACMARLSGPFPRCPL